MESKNVVTFKRIANGEFESYLNGEKTEFRIYNGCLGLDGRDTPNIYMVAKLDTPTKIQGTLQMCKKSITHWLTKRAKEAAQAAPAMKFPAAACQKCGGWTGFGGMSQYANDPVTGCKCFKSAQVA